MGKALAIMAACIIAPAAFFAAGHSYATRNSDVLVEFAAADRAHAKAIDDFSQIIENTDFCHGGSNDG